MIRLRVNGRSIELERPTPLLEYIRELGVDPGAIAVEVNGEIIHRQDRADLTLGDGDVVEIVRMVGGGFCQNVRISDICARPRSASCPGICPRSVSV